MSDPKPAAPKQYFLTELLGNGVLVNGKRPNWEILSGNMGVIELDPATDAATIESLNKLVGTQGIVKISAEEAEKKRTQFPWKELKPNWLDEPLKLANPKKRQMPNAKAPVVPVAGNAPEIPNGPEPRPDFETGNPKSFKPATGRVAGKQQAPAGSDI